MGVVTFEDCLTPVVTDAVGMWSVPLEQRPAGQALLVVTMHLLGDVVSPPVMGLIQGESPIWHGFGHDSDCPGCSLSQSVCIIPNSLVACQGSCCTFCMSFDKLGVMLRASALQMRYRIGTSALLPCPPICWSPSCSIRSALPPWPGPSITASWRLHHRSEGILYTAASLSCRGSGRA